MSQERDALQVARLLADTADEIALKHFGPPLAAQAKTDGSPVTLADRAIESTLRSLLDEHRPGDAVLGEEEGGAIDPDRLTWIIDPIDATKNYMRGIPVFATLIGAVAGGRPVVGVATAPALGERWEAATGQGARRNGAPVAVSDIGDLADAHLLHGGLDHHRALEGGWQRLGELAERAWRTRGFGDFWGHLLVAGGMAEACFEPDLSSWDIVAPACIVTEAGGRVTTWEGGSVIHGGSVLSSNGRVHDVVAAALLGRTAAEADAPRP